MLGEEAHAKPRIAHLQSERRALLGYEMAHPRAEGLGMGKRSNVYHKATREAHYMLEGPTLCQRWSTSFL